MKRRRVLGNLVILIVLFGCAGALVVIVPFLRREPIVPQESSETIAKRHAPENAFFRLIEAVDSLPPAPPFIMSPSRDDPKLIAKYEPEECSLGWLLNVQRPDDDQQLLDYLRACENAATKTREALQSPYFLLPVDWTTRVNETGIDSPLDKFWRFRSLGGILAAEGLRSLRAGDEAGGLSGFLDAVRLGLLIRNDGGNPRFSSTVLVTTLRCLCGTVAAFSNATLERAFAEVRRLHAEVGPPLNNLSFILRDVDHGGYARFYSDDSNPLNREVYRVVHSFRRRQLRVWAKRHRDELFDLVKGPYRPVREWERRTWKENTRWGVGGELASQVEALAYSRAEADVAFNGAALVIALEFYRRSHGSHPETLDALAPEYIDSIPGDPFTGNALIYKRVGEDYQLYSLGIDGEDDGGRVIPEGRTQPVGDDRVVHWPRGASK